MEGRQGRKLHGIWMSCSLERKVRWITISTAAVVILSITAVMLVAGYGMKGFGDLLMGNSRRRYGICRPWIRLQQLCALQPCPCGTCTSGY